MVWPSVGWATEDGELEDRRRRLVAVRSPLKRLGRGAGRRRGLREVSSRGWRGRRRGGRSHIDADCSRVAGVALVVIGDHRDIVLARSLWPPATHSPKGLGAVGYGGAAHRETVDVQYDFVQVTIVLGVQVYLQRLPHLERALVWR